MALHFAVWLAVGVATLALAAAALRLAARWLADAPPARGCCARARARFLRKHVAEWFRHTGTFDSLLAGLEIEHLSEEGLLRASLVARGPLLSSDGFLHEGAVALLVDALTSVAQIASGLLGGLSIEISAEAAAQGGGAQGGAKGGGGAQGGGLAPRVETGERLLAEARVTKVYPKFGIASLELDLYRAGEDGARGELLATGKQTKSFKGRPFHERLLNNLSARFLPLAWFFARADLAATKAARTVVDFKAESMEEVLGVKRESMGGPQGGESRLSAQIVERLRNPYGIAHGAAIAGLLAAAVREHLRARQEKGEVGSGSPVVQTMSFHYHMPLPGNAAVDLVVREAASAGGDSAEKPVTVAAEVQVAGHTFAKGSFAVQLPARPRAPLTRRPLGGFPLLAPRVMAGPMSGFSRRPVPRTMARRGDESTSESESGSGSGGEGRRERGSLEEEEEERERLEGEVPTDPTCSLTRRPMPRTAAKRGDESTSESESETGGEGRRERGSREEEEEERERLEGEVPRPEEGSTRESAGESGGEGRDVEESREEDGSS